MALLPPLAGWTLDAARARLAVLFPDSEVGTCETAPPVRPRRDGKPARTAVWGDWRVLRAQQSESGDGIVLTVAREQLPDPETDAGVPVAP